MTSNFWLNDINVLFNKETIFHVWPTQQMCFSEKLNAISRLVILMSILGFLFLKNWSILIVGVITLAIIVALYKLRKTEGFTNNKNINKETTKKDANNNITINPITMEALLRSDFHPITKKNPFGNVLLTDIGDIPDRLAAAPSFNPDVYDDINTAVKKQTQMLNPGIINTNKQLYGDLYDSYTMDKSMQRFYTTANSRVTQDQGAFANFLFGSMYSGKESTPEGAMMRVKDNYRWTSP